MKKKNLLENWKLWFGILIIILMLSTILIIAIKNKIQQVNYTENSNYSMIGKEIKMTNSLKKQIYEKVKEDITDSLKSPVTATFPEMKDWNIRVNSNNVIEVSSYVDSQNSYGAMLRADFKQKYVLFNQDEYTCIYKEFDNETEFDITENTEYRKFINEQVYDFQMEDFIEKCKNTTIYGSLIDYNYNRDSQNLEINILVKDVKNEYFNYESYAKGVIASYINQCICIPTVSTKLNIKNEEGEVLATVTDIDIDFLLNNWYILWDLGIMNNTDGTELEEKLQDKLWISDKLK